YPLLVEGAGYVQKPQHGVDGYIDCAAFPVLAALDERRLARAGGIAKPAALDNAQSGRMPCIDQQVRRHTDSACKLHALFDAPAHHDRAARLMHRVQIEEKVRTIDERSQLARTS